MTVFLEAWQWTGNREILQLCRRISISIKTDHSLAGSSDGEVVSGRLQVVGRREHAQALRRHFRLFCLIFLDFRARELSSLLSIPHPRHTLVSERRHLPKSEIWGLAVLFLMRRRRESLQLWHVTKYQAFWARTSGSGCGLYELLQLTH